MKKEIKKDIKKEIKKKIEKKICNFCKKEINLRKFEDHLPECIVNYTDGKTGFLIEFIAENNFTNKTYQMFAIIGSKCKFSHIANFIKKIWCDCCNHRSDIHMFEFVDKYKTRQKITLKTPAIEYAHANQFAFTYDFGMPTIIYFRFLQILPEDELTNIDLLYRNEEHILKCNNCDNNAKYVYEETLLCELCKDNTPEPESCNKLNNSPRDGVECYSA